MSLQIDVSYLDEESGEMIEVFNLGSLEEIETAVLDAADVGTRKVVLEIWDNDHVNLGGLR